MDWALASTHVDDSSLARSVQVGIYDEGSIIEVAFIVASVNQAKK